MSAGSGAWRRGPEQDPVAPPGPDESPGSATTPVRPGSHIIRPMPSSTASFQDLASRSVAAVGDEHTRFEVPRDLSTRGELSETLPLRRLIALALTMIVLGIAAGVVWVTVIDRQGPDVSSPEVHNGGPSPPQGSCPGVPPGLG
ncbi:MAG: hypothetical protein ACTHWA_05980 [Arachnia sp.]